MRFYIISTKTTEAFSNIWNWISEGTSKHFTFPIFALAIYKLIIYTCKLKRNYIDKKLLNTMYDVAEIKKAHKNFIRTKCQNIDPSDEINLSTTFAFATKEDLIKFFLKKAFQTNDSAAKFYLILGDSGMGKTTFMLNLFSKFNRQNRFQFNDQKITLLPLGLDKATLEKEIQKISNPKKTTILLDGLDEAPYISHEDINFEFDKLIELVKDFNKVLITCRTHYFSSEKDEPNELKIKKFNTDGNGYYSIKKIYISPFEAKDINRYFNKSLGIFSFRKKKTAREILKKTDDLLLRPMLLSHITELVKENQQEFKNRVDIYEALLLAWLNREIVKQPQNNKEIFKSNLAFFTYEICKNIYYNYSTNGLYISLKDIEILSQEYNIDLSKIELKSRSLLNRNSNGEYKFAHKSIFEFTLAYLAYESRQLNGEHVIIPFDLTEFDQAVIFFEEMVYSSRLEFKLPTIHRKYDNTNKELLSRVLLEKSRINNNSTKKIKWIDHTSYKIQ